jgi:hypothetical protein
MKELIIFQFFTGIFRFIMIHIKFLTFVAVYDTIKNLTEKRVIRI